jgi:hypothetical protein
MADQLSISASIAGLMTIADIVIRNGYKYVIAAKNADKAVASLIREVNSLSGTLHSLEISRKVWKGRMRRSFPRPRYTTSSPVTELFVKLTSYWTSLSYQRQRA